MIIINNKDNRFFCLMIEREVESAYLGPHISEQFRYSTLSKHNPESFIALEIKSVAGPMSPYGLLGLKYTPFCEKRSSFKLHGGSAKQKYRSILFPESKTIYVGLPLEFHLAIRDAVKLYLERGFQLPSGNVAIEYAAYCEVNSNNYLFKKLMYICLVLLTLNPEDRANINFNSLFDEAS